MIYTLYHGSPKIVRVPQYGIGNIHNDYGRAFYCTESIKMAKEWAVDEGCDGYANCYALDGEGLKILDLQSGDYHILNWLAILLANREFRIESDVKNRAKTYVINTFLPEYEEYDCIIGYRADDSYFSFANLFLNNGLSIEKLGEVMKLGALGEQFAIKSQSAFDRIKFVSAERADSIKYYPLKKNRDEKARNSFRNMKENISEGTYILDIIREEWRNDDERLQRMLRI